MKDVSLIDLIISTLKSYPDIRFDKKNDTELIVYPSDDNGFSIWLEIDERENTLGFEFCHWHYDNTDEGKEELVDQLIKGLTGVLRIKEFSKNGKAYKWIIQIQDKNGIWNDSGTTLVFNFNFNFWTKAEIKYYQNHLLPEEI